MPTVLIGGGSGLIGSRLSQHLTDAGYQVRHFSRKPSGTEPYPTFAWDPAGGTWDERAQHGVDYLVNLAGAGIADGRWTAARKTLIIESRTQSTALLGACAERIDPPPKAFVSASAIGYYGDRGDTLLTEEDDPGEGFLAESVQAWEQAIWAVREQTGMRTAAIRIGLVLSMQGGSLEQLLLPVKLFSAPYFGDGKQWMSWIHIDDLCRLFIWAMEQEGVSGSYNGVAPRPVRQLDFMETLAKVWQRPALRFPVPSAFMRLGMGEMAELVLGSTRVSAQKVVDAGFPFSFDELEPALADLKHSGH